MSFFELEDGEYKVVKQGNKITIEIINDPVVEDKIKDSTDVESVDGEGVMYYK